MLHVEQDVEYIPGERRYYVLHFPVEKSVDKLFTISTDTLISEYKLPRRSYSSPSVIKAERLASYILSQKLQSCTCDRIKISSIREFLFGTDALHKQEGASFPFKKFPQVTGIRFDIFSYVRNSLPSAAGTGT